MNSQEYQSFYSVVFHLDITGFKNGPYQETPLLATFIKVHKSIIKTTMIAPKFCDLVVAGIGITHADYKILKEFKLLLG